ncbi:MAG: SH3 domain-containing protein, partial [Planctomycetes bacterium]|nr:SH3 domain-containing protein [Planctomycetota bacterium]
APAAPTVGATDAGASTMPAEGTAGVITGGRVNIRAGDSTKYEIVYTADPETPVTVYEKKGEWVKIGFPEKEFCYVEQRAVEGDVPAEIPEQGVGCTVRNDGAKVYVRPWAGSTVVGSVKAGESVVVTGARGQFLRIRPPATAYAWVFEKFIRYNGASVQTVELTDAEKEARAKENEKALRQTVDDLKSGKGKLMSAREANPLLLKLRERTQVERKQREAQREAVKSMVANIDKQMELIDAETAARIADIDRNRVDMARLNEEAMRVAEEGYRPGPPPGSMGNSATGWIEHVAFWRGRPAEYRLVKGQEIICYIRSSRYNLADYNGRRVVVTGNLVKSVNGKVDVLSVDTLRLFEQSQVETPISSLPPVTQAPLRPAPAPQALADDGVNSVRVIRESTTTTTYSNSQGNSFRPIDRSQHVVTFRDDPVRLEQNEDIVIIEDTPGSASQLRVGQRVDVTGMPTP